MLETIYLCRHGFRLSWETSVWNAPTNTPRDPPLSAHGETQAVELADWFASLPEEERPQLIISSPLYRCLQTATPLASRLSLPIYVEHGIGEWYLPIPSTSRTQHPQSLPASRLRQWFPAIKPESSADEYGWETLLYVERKGETEEDIHERAKVILEKVVTRVEEVRFGEEEEVKRVVLFTHAATNIAMGRALIGDRQKEIRSATCSVGKYVRRRGKEEEGDRKVIGDWEMVKNGETSMLKQGEERHWDFTYVEAHEEEGVMDDGTEAGTLASDNYKKAPIPASSSSSSSPPGKL